MSESMVSIENLKSPDPLVRKAALEAIERRSHLAQIGSAILGIAKTDPVESIRGLAVSKIEMLAMEFYSGAVNGPDGEALLFAKTMVEMVLHSKSIFENARNHPDMHVRWFFTNLIEDQGELELIGLHDEDSTVQIAAAEKIRSEQILYEIAMNSGEWFLFDAALENIINQDFLQKIAVGHHITEFRNSVINRLTNEAVLCEIAKTDPDYQIRFTATQKLTKEEFLVDLAANGLDVEFEYLSAEKPLERLVAFRKIQNQSLKKQVIRNVEEPIFRELLRIDILTDQELLCIIAKTHENSKFQRFAIDKLTDMTTLRKIAEGRFKPFIANAARMRLSELVG